MMQYLQKEVSVKLSITKSVIHAVRNSNAYCKGALNQSKSLEEEELQSKADKRRKKQELEEDMQNVGRKISEMSNKI